MHMCEMRCHRSVRSGRAAAVCVMVLCIVAGAWADGPAKAAPGVDLDRLLDDFLKVKVAALRAKQAQFQALVKDLPGKAKALRDQAGGLDAQAGRMQQRLVLLRKLTGALAGQTPSGSPPPLPASRPAAGPDVDRLLDTLLSLDPKALAAKTKQIEDQIAGLKSDAQAKRTEAAAMEARVAAAQRRLALLPKLIAVLEPPKAAQAPKPAPKPPPAPAATQPSKAATGKAISETTSVNFRQHISPILDSRCTGCHNPDKAKGGLILVSFDALLEGGSSGAVVQPGRPDASRLFRLVSHVEEPNMPPRESGLSEDKLVLIRNWIAQGAAAAPDSGPTDADSAAAAVRGPRLKDLVSVSHRKGPPPMPEAAPARAENRTRLASAVRALAVSPVAPLVAVSGTHEIHLYHLDTRERLAILPFDGTPQCLQFSVDGRVLVCAGGRAGKSGVAIAYDVRTGDVLGEFGTVYDSILAAAMSPDGGLIVAGGPSRRARAYDTSSGSLVYEIKAHNDWIYALAINEYGDLLATGDRASGLFVWEADTGREVHVLRGHSGAISGLCFHGESDVLASASEDGTVRLWEMEEGRQIKSWTAHNGAALAIAFASDGRLATTGADRRLRIWQRDGKLIRNIEPLSDWAYCVAFSPDGTRVITGTWDGQVTIWDAASGKQVGTLGGGTAPST